MQTRRCSPRLRAESSLSGSRTSASLRIGSRTAACARWRRRRGGSMRRLKVLDLSGNRVGAEGRRALGNALEAPGALPSLISLSLNNAAGERRLTLEEAEVLAQQSAHAQRHKRLLSAKGLVPQ